MQSCLFMSLIKLTTNKTGLKNFEERGAGGGGGVLKSVIHSVSLKVAAIIYKNDPILCLFLVL